MFEETLKTNLDRDRRQAGIVAVPPGAAVTTGVASTSILRATRLVPSRDMTITSIAFAVSVAATNDDLVDVGIYDAAWSRLVSSGATAGKANSTGAKTITVASTALKAGTVYYLALAYGTPGGTAATFVLIYLGAPGAGLLFQSSATPAPPTAEIALFSTGTCPSTLTGPTATPTAYLLAARE